MTAIFVIVIIILVVIIAVLADIAWNLLKAYSKLYNSRKDDL